MGRSRAESIMLRAVLVLIAVPLALYLIWGLYMAVPIRWIHITSGHAGIFDIGETRESIIARLSNESFSPQPKPLECPRNWIGVSDMTATERNCLLSSDVWIEGVSSMRSQVSVRRRPSSAAV
jgi:hypothetical protein